MSHEVIQRRVFARLGLLGNPSDGYYGRTISVSLANYFAEVSLTPAAAGDTRVAFLPNPESDPTEFPGGLPALSSWAAGCGYYGGLRLLQATCKCFHDYCCQRGLDVASRQPAGFSLAYSTNIPRQLGLSGSSAITLAALNCLLAHYDVEGAVPVEDRPGLVLRAEAELGITAGLQDRVIQTYGGAVYMDFGEEAVQRTGRGRYASLDPATLPPLHLIYAKQPAGKDSGGVHAGLRRRWLEGDPAVSKAMASLAELALRGRAALEAGDVAELDSLMRQNFALRRQLFGDEALGARNLALVEAAASVGAAAKLSGSGGAVVALCPEGPHQEQQLAEACQRAGFVCERVQVAPSIFTVNDFD